MQSLVLDSSCWIEILTGGPLAGACEREWKSRSTVLVPTVVVFEVYRKITSRVSEEQALEVVAALSQHEVMDLNRDIVLLAADLSILHRLGMADSMVLAHAVSSKSLLVTLDNDFAGIQGTKVLRPS